MHEKRREIAETVGKLTQNHEIGKKINDRSAKGNNWGNALGITKQ